MSSSSEGGPELRGRNFGDEPPVIPGELDLSRVENDFNAVQ